MSRGQSLPSYRLHKPSGQAVVTIRLPGGGRRDIYLGEYNSPDSRREYGRVISELATASVADQVVNSAFVPDLTIDELLLAFWRHAEIHYRRADGTPTHELVEYKQSFKPLRELYGHTKAKGFGSLALKTVRAKMIARGLCRRLVNQRVGRIRRAFKWAAAEQIVPVATYQCLTTLPGLQRGRTPAHDCDPIEPVTEAHILATLIHLPRQVRGIVQFELLTGCRPGEACMIRPLDVEMNGSVATYRPTQHKTSWRGKQRVVAIGPKAQKLLMEYAPSESTDYYFSPRRTVAELHAARTASRKTPRFPSHMAHNEARRVRLPGSRRSPHYTPTTYGRAIARAVEKVNTALIEAAVEVELHVPPWSPNQLRHAHATEVRRRFGLEAAQVALGHERADVTQVYAERNFELAAKVAAAIG